MGPSPSWTPLLNQRLMARVSDWNKSSEFTLLTFTTFVPRPKKGQKIFFKIFGHRSDTPRPLKFATI